MIAARIARRLVRKAIKPAALYVVELQLLASEARDERKRRVELIGRRNLIRGW